MTNQEQNLILAGPSREELFDALRLRHEGRKVAFTVTVYTIFVYLPLHSLERVKTEKKTINFSVDSIGVEDGSGNKWLLKLYDPQGNLGSRYLTGYFETIERKGWLEKAPQK